MLAGVANDRADILLVARNDHPGWRHLEQRGIGPVQSAGKIVEQHFPTNEPLEVVVGTFAESGVHVVFSWFPDSVWEPLCGNLCAGNSVSRVAATVEAGYG